VSARDPFRTSVNEQIHLGQQVAAQIRRQFHALQATDQRVQVLRRIGRRILSTFPDSETWQYSFDVLDNKEVNAFALPGGPTFFFTGLIDKLKTEDEIAGILGHELTHVRQQHWARIYSEMQKRQLFMTAALIFLRVNYTGAQLIDLANNLLDLKYSRNDEAAADQGGFENSANAGYNPQGLADAFTLLDKLGGHEPEFLSDHPSDKKRISHIEDDIKGSGKSFPAQRALPWATP
jgi:predicted Zn-dependent protease